MKNYSMNNITFIMWLLILGRVHDWFNFLLVEI